MSLDNQEIGNSIVKSLFAAIPFAGQPLNELFYDYRGRVKQNRLNDFNELLSSHFQQHGEVNFNELNAVEFSDLFEAIIIQVTRTSSMEKHQRFRDILINYIENPAFDMDYGDTYLDLILGLNENAINILKFHDKFSDGHLIKEQEKYSVNNLVIKKKDQLEKEHKSLEKGDANNFTAIETELNALNVQLSTIESEIKYLRRYQDHTFYHLTTDQFLYLKQILYTKGLMLDSGTGSIGHIPFSYMKITLFGQEFLKYIIKD